MRSRRHICVSRTALALTVCISWSATGISIANAANEETKAAVAASREGALIAANGTAHAPACAGCHAFDGSSDSSGAFPRITGLPAAYIEAQMRDFASGVRNNAIMSPIAKDLTPAEINSVAEYYGAATAPFPVLKSANPALIKLGEQIASTGDAAKGIPGCDACHGPQGNGQLGIAPYLGGQYDSYIAFTLHMWQWGYRKNSSDVMETFAKMLDNQQIEAVAAYYQQVYVTGPDSPHK